MSEIAKGYRTVMEMIGEDPEKYWNMPFMGQPSVAKVLDTPEKVDAFNEAVERSLAESKQRGITGFRAAQIAMQCAGNTILGANRPEMPSATEQLLKSAGPILRRVDRPQAEQPPSEGSTRFGGILRSR